MRFIKRLIVLLLIYLIGFTMAACLNKVDDQQDNENKQVIEDINQHRGITKYPLIIRDSYEREIIISKEPERIVSLAPNITETICSLDKIHLLVGRTDFCDYPEQVNSIQSIGTLQKPNYEKIAELKPDFVISSTHFSREALKKFDELGIPVVILYEREGFEGAYNTIEKVGEILNASEKASTIITTMKNKVDHIKAKVEGKAEPSLYYVLSFGKFGDFAATGDTFIDNMIEMAGGKNIAKEGRDWKYSLEKLIEKNPQLIIVSKYYGTRNAFIEATGYRELTAVKSNRVLEIDNNILDRQGPRLADGLEALSKLIHPELFK